MNKQQAESEFRNYILPQLREQYEQDGKPDYVARFEAWNNFTDALCKDGEITSHQYETWVYPAFCGK